MSAGAVFKLIANDGKADKLITATDLLNQRLHEVKCERTRRGVEATPTLPDIEKSHILYVNSHFKPYAAIGYEYNKVRSSTGTVALGSSVQFSIPQFGDFFHDMVIRTRLSAVTAKQGVTAPLPAPAVKTVGAAGGNDDEYYQYAYVDADGNELTTTAADTVTYANYVRYCEFPGNRLFENVKFEVNGNPLDQYDYMVPVMHEKYLVAPNKRVGYNRLCGQEVPLVGYSGSVGAAVFDRDSKNTAALKLSGADPNQSPQTSSLYNRTGVKIGTAAPSTSVFSLSGATATTALGATPSAPQETAAGALQYDVSRQRFEFLNGPQTAKPAQPPLELWTPLRFWFNEDVRNSIPSVSIPFGMRFITVQLVQQTELLFEVPSVYLRTTVSTAVDQTTPGLSSTTRHTFTPFMQHNGINELQIEKMEMYIDNIFVNPEIHDIFIKRISFTLIRVYRQQQIRCTGPDEKLLSQIKWPVEYMMVGMRPIWNVSGTAGTSTVTPHKNDTGANTTAAAGAAHVVPAAGTTAAVDSTKVIGNETKYRDWHRFSYNLDCQVQDAVNVTGKFGANGAVSQTVVTGRIAPLVYHTPVSTVDALSVTTHGILIYDQFGDMMFNQYLPYHFGGSIINTPEDTGVMFINMALYPGQQQPSGHINVSRARETYIKVWTTYASSATPCELFVVAVCINFLLISDGSAVLRFST
jgi:hypothetical protein